MPQFILFDPETGEIVDSGRSGSLKQVMAQGLDGHLLLIGSADRTTQYVDVGTVQIVARPLFYADTEFHVLADGVSQLEFKLPPGTIVRQEGEAVTLPDGHLGFGSAVEGEFSLEIAPPFPFQVQTLKVVADEAPAPNQE